MEKSWGSAAVLGWNGRASREPGQVGWEGCLRAVITKIVKPFLPYKIPAGGGW